MTEVAPRTQVSSGRQSLDPDEQGWWSLVTSLGVLGLGGSPRARLAARVLEVGLSLAFVLIALSPRQPRYGIGLASAAVSTAAWLSWVAVGERRRSALLALTALAAAGGVCGAVHRSGLLFAFVPVAATSFSYPAMLAVGECAVTFASYLVTNAAVGPFPGPALTVAVPCLAGLTIGVGRRQFLERARRAAQLATAERRANVADQERELVTERNRLGREIHDVLAHTLGAVSIQLTALDSRVKAGDDPAALRARIRALHSLVGDGLHEARDAVRALQDEKLSLETQIGRLCALHAVVPHVEGRPRLIGAEPALALYRVVQESLTNAAKHAPGGSLAVSLHFSVAGVSVVIDNGASEGGSSALASQGGGHGLSGMRSRVALAGGRCSAGPHAAGWRVEAFMPVTDRDEPLGEEDQAVTGEA